MKAAWVICVVVVLVGIGVLLFKFRHSGTDVGSSAGSPTSSATSEPSVQWVDPKTLQVGPYQRDSLNEEQLARVRRIHETFAAVDGMPLERRIDDFRRDMNLDRELSVWERMAAAYSRYTASHDLSPEAKKEVYKVVLMRSMAPPDQVLAHLPLEILSERQAREVMSGY